MRLQRRFTRALSKRVGEDVGPGGPGGPGGRGGGEGGGGGDSPSSSTTPQGKTLIIAAIFISSLFFFITAYIVLRYIRQTHPLAPKFFPEKWKKKWVTWQPQTYSAAASSSSRVSDTSATERRDRDQERRERRERRRREQQQQQHATPGVNRVESVRSIMTLPEYRAAPLPDRERTIGREGERAGIDVVIEAPETAEEEEDRREDHMQALYEVRLARQLERAAEREGAQNGGGGRGSHRNRGSNSATSLAATLAAVQERERRLSEVSYAEVGLARPDGTRVRASSEVSDRDSLPLLDAGAPMGTGNSIRSGRSSHVRNNSALSLASTLGTPEQRRSDEIFNMGSATHDADRPPGYTGGANWGAPPEYPGPHMDDERGGDMGVPMVRVENSSPDPHQASTRS